ncbi:DNA ligase 4 [Phalaenopsis equestris]|uniref:DNA ligase 4 n=2 Tax=Phalaenopsis equestris TaxID=78828 RepID=UPI0009E2D14E|nr:DNA ligase 4 [Phalaenopsis equestris]
MTDSTVRFGLLCSMFEAMVRDRSAAKKRKRFRTFLDLVYTGRDFFSAIRLILPSLDRERGTYGLKESALAAALVDALGISKDSEDALRLINWRKGGARTGANAGNFALVAADILQRRQGSASGGLTIREVNDALDQLSLKEGRGEKAGVLSGFIKKTNAVEMKWIIMIILKDLKMGISEKSIFHEFHPDAEDLFNVTCDLKLVCEKLKDRSQRHKRQDIEVGKAVRPQLALRISDATTAWRKFHGKQIVAECKFDGDRIQIHRNGKEIHFFSRNFLDHTEYLQGMSDVILQNILVDRCILDGEMLVWDTSTNRFAEFGSNQEIAKAAMQGLQGDRQLCYVAFDILYAGDTSVIHQSLTERHELLHKVVKPLRGRLEILVPNDGLNLRHPVGQPCWSIIVNCVEEVEKFFKETVENRDEGIVLKDLSSKWEPGDRSGKWLKLKPDYIHAGADLDVLIIGGYFGSGRHGGEVAQFLVGLAERSDSTSFPKRFLSFCRVGTGLTDEDLDVLITKLKPHLRKNEYPKRSPPFYEVTNNSKERPDVWVESPDKSVILSITSDIRTIKSEVFAAPYSLRFPRIQRVRYDKQWHECLDVESFRDLVQSSNGTTQRRVNQGALQQLNGKPKRIARKGEKRSISVITPHSIQADVSAVKKTLIFANMMFYFVNVPSSSSVDYFHRLVIENAGKFSMNLNDTVTHCIAAEKKGIKYQAAIRHGDIIHYSWFLDCCNQKKLVHLQPKYFLFFADSSKKKYQEEIDAFSDYYYWDVDIEDIKQIFCNMIGSVNSNSKMIEHYRKKYLPVRRMGLFHGCFIYLHEMPFRNTEFKVISELAMRRMKLEIAMHGGNVCDDMEPATHLLVYSVVGSHDFDEIYESIPSTQRHLLHQRKFKTLLDLPHLILVFPLLLSAFYRLLKHREQIFCNMIGSVNSNSKMIEHYRKKYLPVRRMGLFHGCFIYLHEMPFRNTEFKVISELAMRRMKLEIAMHGGNVCDDMEPATHLLVYSVVGSHDFDEIYESIPSTQRHLLHQRKLHVLVHNWLQDSLDRSVKLPENDYNMKPDSLEEYAFEKKDNPTFPAIKCEAEEQNSAASGKRKRGRRPAGQAGVVRPARRPTRRSRAKTGKHSAKLGSDESDSIDSMEVAPTAYVKERGETEQKWRKEEHEEQSVKTERNQEITDLPVEECNSLNLMDIGDKSGDKLEVMTDPIHAMLLDMIPSLSQTQKRHGEVDPIRVADDEKAVQAREENQNPAKKKVSYKDVAGELLKDW